MSAKLEITGFAAVDNALKEFHPKWQKKAIDPALKAGMKDIVLRAAKSDVRANHYKSGQLFKSLKVRKAKGSGNRRLPRNVLGWQIEPAQTKTIDAYYAKWVFFDRRLRDGRKRKGSRTLRRALYDNAGAYKAFTIGKIRADLPGVIRQVRLDSLKYKG